MITPSFSQLFSGRLTYNYITHDSIRREESYRQLKLNVKAPYTMTRTAWIKKDSIRFVSANNYNRLDWVDYQYGKVHYTNMSNDESGVKIYERLVMPRLPKMDISTVLLEKGKIIVPICGYDCKEYIYQHINLSSPKIRMTKVWIPIKLKFKKQHNYGNNFEYFFFPDGLAFKREEYVDGVLINSCELTNIAFYDVPNDQLDECEEVPKKID
jgi:hypothetical protein